MSKRVLSGSRPTSAKSSKNRSSQPYQGRSLTAKSRVKKRPTTAYNRLNQTSKQNLDDSLNNPFGSSPGEDEDILLNLDTQNKHEVYYAGVDQPDSSNMKTGTLNTIEKPNEYNRTTAISPMYAGSKPKLKKFKRPQSAKTQFMSQTGRFRKTSTNKDYSTLELAKIFDNNDQKTINEQVSSVSRLSKPPLSSCMGYKRRNQKHGLKPYNKYSSLAKAYNSSEMDYRTTLSSFHKVSLSDQYIFIESDPT